MVVVPLWHSHTEENMINIRSICHTLLIHGDPHLLNQSHYQLNHLAKSTCWKIELDNPLMNWSKTTSITRFTSRTTLVMKMANWPALLVSSTLISLPYSCCLIIVHLTSNGKGFTVRWILPPLCTMYLSSIFLLRKFFREFLYYKSWQEEEDLYKEHFTLHYIYPHQQFSQIAY